MEAKRPALFLDRDGVMIHDKAYLRRTDEVEFFEEIFEIIHHFQRHPKHYRVIVLTNQSGIARGLFTEQECQQVTRHIDTLLASHGITLDAWYSCPYHPSGSVVPFNQESSWRKPQPGMLLQALSDFPIDLAQSLMIGDKSSDILEVPASLNLPTYPTYLIKGQYAIEKSEGAKVFKNHKDLLTFLKTTYNYTN